MKIGKASNQAKVGESVNVEVDGKTHDAIAGNTITSSKVLIVKDSTGKKTAFSESSPYQTYGNSKIKRKRPTGKKKTVYPVVVLATIETTVQTEGGDAIKTEFWVYGDDKPKKAYELELPSGSFVEGDDLRIHNFGSKWEIFIKHYDDTIEIPIPPEYDGIGGLPPGYIESQGSYIIGFIQKDGTVKTYGKPPDTPLALNLNINYRGDGWACHNPYFVWRDVWRSTFIFNLFPFTPTTLYSWNETYPGESLISTNYYLLDGITDTIEVPLITFSEDYNFAFYPTIDSIKHTLDPIAKGADFRTKIGNGTLNSFLIKSRNGNIQPQGNSNNWFADLITAQIPSVTDYFDEVLRSSRNLHPFHTVKRSYYQSAMIPIFTQGNYHTAPYVQNYSFDIQLDHDEFYNGGFSRFANSAYQFKIEQTDNFYIPIPLINKNEYSFNPFNLIGSSMTLNNSFNKYDDQINTYSKQINCERTAGNQTYNYFGIEKEAFMRQASSSGFLGSGTSGVSTIKSWYTASIPYPYLIGKNTNSFILATFDVKRLRDESYLQSNYEETYVFYKGNTAIPLTDLGDLETEYDRGGVIFNRLDITPFDTLVGNTIYRVVQNSDLTKSKTAIANLSVEQYKITDEGAIVKGATKKYPVQALGKAGATIWGASFFV